MSPHDKAIAEAEGKLVALLGEAKQMPEVFPRVELWIARMTGGRKLSEYLHDAAVTPASRVLVARSLVEILLAKSYDRLPAEAGVEAPGASLVAATVAPQLTDELRSLVRHESRLQLAAALETIAKVLRETA